MLNCQQAMFACHVMAQPSINVCVSCQRPSSPKLRFTHTHIHTEGERASARARERERESESEGERERARARWRERERAREQGSERARVSSGGATAQNSRTQLTNSHTQLTNSHTHLTNSHTELTQGTLGYPRDARVPSAAGGVCCDDYLAHVVTQRTR